MSAIFLLLGLLVFSYVGSFLVRGRATGGFGLPSGVEYVTLGFFFGPQVLGIVDRPTLLSFAPIEQAALGWLALITGLEFGRSPGRSAPLPRVLLAIASTAVVGGIIGGLSYLLLSSFKGAMGPKDIGLLCGGLGAVGAETTRHTVSGLLQRHEARGPLSEFIADVSESDAIVPLLTLAWLFCLRPNAEVRWAIPAYGWFFVTLAAGGTIGAIAAVLLRDGFDDHEGWGALLGTSLLAIGLAIRLDLSILTVAFSMGLALAIFSPHRDAIIATVTPTEDPVLLPILLLAGTHINLHIDPRLGAVVGLAILCRILGKAFVGIGTTSFRSQSISVKGPGHGALVGLALLPSGIITIGIGLAFALRFPGPIGDTVLVAAAISIIVGEFVGPTMLRKALVRSGETGEMSSAPPPSASLEGS